MGSDLAAALPGNAVLHIFAEEKSESEMGEDDGSVLFAEGMDIRDSDSDSFYSEGLHSTDDEMEDDICLDLDMENDKEDDSSEESDCFYEKLIVAEGSKQKQMGKYDVCEQPQWMEEDDDGIEGHTRSAGSTCFQLNEPPSFEAFLCPGKASRSFPTRSCPTPLHSTPLRSSFN